MVRDVTCHGRSWQFEDAAMCSVAHSTASVARRLIRADLLIVNWQWMIVVWRPMVGAFGARSIGV